MASSAAFRLSVIKGHLSNKDKKNDNEDLEDRLSSEEKNKGIYSSPCSNNAKPDENNSNEKSDRTIPRKRYVFIVKITESVSLSNT